MKKKINDIMMATAFVVLLAGVVYVWAVSKEKKAEHKTVISQQLGEDVKEWKQLMDSCKITYKDAANRIDSILLVDNIPDCGISSFRNNTIRISKKCYEQGELCGKSLLWHELAHYVFQIDHKDGTIMDPFILPEDYCKKNWKLLKDSYINQCKGYEINGGF